MAYFRTGTNDFSSIQYTNLTAGNIKKGITVTVKDPNDITLKSVTGSYDPKLPIEELKGHAITAYGTWSGSNFNVNIYYDGTLAASKSYSQYDSYQLSIKSNSNSVTSGGYTLTGGRLISGDNQYLDFYLNGYNIYRTTAVSFYSNIPTCRFTIS